MKKPTLKRWDATEHLKDEQDCLLYLQAVMEDADVNEKLIAAALGDIARARGMMQISRETGLAREALYKALSSEGNPTFATVLKVAKALGFQFSVTLSGKPDSHPPA
ncbi:MAG: addiction module antidote protein [Alcanivoracaceae bacterium]